MFTWDAPLMIAPDRVSTIDRVRDEKADAGMPTPYGSTIWQVYVGVLPAGHGDEMLTIGDPKVTPDPPETEERDIRSAIANVPDMLEDVI